MIKNILFFVLTCAFLILSPLESIVQAGSRFSATITALSGEVMIQKAGEEIWLPLEINTPLESSDRIRTGSGAYAEIMVDDGSLMKIEENTEIYLKELSVDSHTKKIKSNIFLRIGTLLSNIAKFIHPGSSFTIFTSTMVAGVRGTEFVVETTDSEKTDVGVFSGELEVGSADPSGNMIKGTQVILKKGFQSTVYKSRKPLRPFAIKGRMLAFKSKIKNLRKRAIENRRKLPEIIKRRLKEKDRIFHKWNKIRKLQQQGVEDKKKKRPRVRRIRKRRR